MSFKTLGFNKLFPDFSFENTIIKNVTEENILVIVIDNNLNFKSHLKKIREKDELLFRHIFETQIHIQTQIRKTFILALATNDFL